MDTFLSRKRVGAMEFYVLFFPTPISTNDGLSKDSLRTIFLELHFENDFLAEFDEYLFLYFMPL